jgi:hypothetical protein
MKYPTTTLQTPDQAISEWMVEVYDQTAIIINEGVETDFNGAELSQLFIGHDLQAANGRHT